MKYILRDRTVVEEPNLYVWAYFFEQADPVVKKTQVTPDIEVSTVFLGIDHSFGHGPPLLFKTMIFGGSDDCEQWHYSTYNQALEGHDVVVAEQETRLNLSAAD